MLVVDVDTLQPIHFLDFIDQIFLQLLFTQDGQDVMRIARTIHQRLARLDALPFLHGDMDAARQRVLLGFAVLGHDDDLSLALGNLPVLHHAVDFADDSSFVGLAGFEQLDHARESAGNVFRLGGFARDFGQHVAGQDLIAILHHEVRARRHQVFPHALRHALLPAADNELGLVFLVGRIGHNPSRKAGDFVDLFMKRDALLEIFELHRTAHFREDGKRVRVPFHDDVPELDGRALGGPDLGAVNHGIAFTFAALFVDDRHRAVPVHGHVVTVPVFHGLQALKPQETVVPGFQV